MEYSKIIAVTGLPGLYELVNSKSDGAIVKSLEDKSSKFVSNRVHNFSHLESIEVFTVRENVNLVEILTAMDNSTEKLPDEKDAKAVKHYFEKVYPDLDLGRVYYSDLKKMIKWFSILRSNNIELVLSTLPEEKTPVTQEPIEEPVPEIVPEEKQATKPKKAAPKKTVEKKEKTAGDKPKKAAARKKAKK